MYQFMQKQFDNQLDPVLIVHVFRLWPRRKEFLKLCALFEHMLHVLVEVH